MQNGIDKDFYGNLLNLPLIPIERRNLLENERKEIVESFNRFSGDTSIINLINSANHSALEKVTLFKKILYLGAKISLAMAKDDMEPDVFDGIVETTDRTLAQQIFLVIFGIRDQNIQYVHDKKDADEFNDNLNKLFEADPMSDDFDDEIKEIKQYFISFYEKHYEVGIKRAYTLYRDDVRRFEIMQGINCSSFSSAMYNYKNIFILSLALATTITNVAIATAVNKCIGTDNENLPVIGMLSAAFGLLLGYCIQQHSENSAMREYR